MTQAIDFADRFARLAQTGATEDSVETGGIRVRMVRVAADTVGTWDSHAETTETAMVWSGDFTVEFRDTALSLGAGQCCVVPVGTEHRATSREGAEVVLFTQV